MPVLARSKNLVTAETHSFRSMILAGESSRLAEIKAVSSGYPLRGELKISPSLFTANSVTQALPKSGEVWAGPQLLQQLGLRVGDTVQVGNLLLRISAVLSYEPDRSGNLFSIAPRLLMNLDDLPSTGLVQEGSHIHYALLVSGEASALERFRKK